MTTWQTVELDQVARIDRSSIKPEAIEPGTAYLGLEHIEHGGEITDPQTVNNGELKSSKFRFGPDHLLYGKLRPYLAKIAAPDFDGICSTDIIPLLPGKDIDKRYLLHFLRQKRMVDYATSRASGANLPRLSPKELAKFKIPLPPLAEQKRIAAILDAADALRAKRRETLAQLDTLPQSTFLEMFGDPVTNAMGWSQASFGDLIVSGPQNGLYKPAKLYGSGVRILRIDGFYNGVVSDIAALKHVEASKKEIDKYGLVESDVVVNRVNSRSHLGKCALIPALSEPVIFESNMMRLRLDTERVLPRFATEFLQTQYVKNQILRACKDAINQSSINQDDVKGLQVLVPPLDLQRHFATIVQSVEQQKSRLRAHLDELDTLFASLQARAFSGTL